MHQSSPVQILRAREVVRDRRRVEQVLLNLAGNAIKFTQTGGVSVIVEPGERDREVRFVVRDTGTYSEQVTVQNFVNGANGYTLTIMADPSFVSSAPVVT